MEKVISYRIAPSGDYYEGHVLRVVTADIGNGIQAVLSATTTGMELEEFQRAYPNVPVDGQTGRTLADEVSMMDAEDLSALGLKRVEGVTKKERPRREEEDLKATYIYPVHEGYGWYRLSNGNKVKSKISAKHRQDMIFAGTPEPEDVVEE
jgi:hypothetical protein